MKRTMIGLVTAIAAISFTAWALTFTTLSWTPPTEYENGEPIEAGDLEKYSLYRNGVHHSDVPATETSLQVPDVCTAAVWTATAWSVNGLESQHSNEVTQVVKPGSCIPEAPVITVE